MFRIYIWMDGQKFDADNFQSCLGASLKGSVEVRKRMNNGVVEQYGKYWSSEVQEIAFDRPEEEVTKLLRRYEFEIRRAKASNATRIVAEIVAEYDTVDDVRGFYFSTELIRLLAELGVSIDIDIVRRLS